MDFSDKCQIIADINDEVKVLHPLLRDTFRHMDGVTEVEYTHGTNEKGADLIITRFDSALGRSHQVGVIAKRGKIVSSLDDIYRQIEECQMPRKILERWPRLFGQKTFFDKWNLASCGRLTGDAVGFDLPGFYTKRIELGGACGRRDARWESRQTFPRQAARCATAHRPQIHGVPSSCLTPLLGLRTRVPRSRRRPASCHPGSDGVVARCRSVDTWPGWLSHRRRCHKP